MPTDPTLKSIIKQMSPAIESSLDPVCVVNSENQIVYANPSMRNLLQVRARDLSKEPVLCDLIQFAACKPDCQMVHLLKTGEPLRLDEAPAARGQQKLRVLAKGIPLYSPEDADKSAPIGAVVSVRDTTAEILLQAKYHKITLLLQDRDSAIQQLKDRIFSLRKSLRDSAGR